MKREVTKFDKVIGWIGAFLIVLAYFLLTFEFVVSHDILYNMMNLVGASLMAYRVWVDRNFSNLALEIVFIIIALFALAKVFF